MGWIGTTAGVPSARSFGSTGGEGTPINIDTSTNVPYYFKKGIGATPLAAIAGSSGVKPGYGQLVDKTVQAQTVNASWTPILNYDTVMPAPVGVAQAAAAGTLTIADPGVYVLTMGIDLTFTSSNGARNTYMRLFNVSDGVSSADVRLPIGRDTDGLVYTASILFTVILANRTARVEIGNGFALSNVTRNGCSFGVHRISA